MNKIFQYYLNKNDSKSAMRIKSAYYFQDLPHQKQIRREKRLQIKFDKLRNLQNEKSK